MGVPPVIASSSRLAGNSLTVAGWTAVSRVTGFGRVAATAAVLGPTYLGNIYQATNVVPNYLYSALTGPLFAALLVPPLVRHIDARDRHAEEALVGAFLGIAVLAFTAVAVLVLAAGPLLLRLLTLGVDDPAAAAAQRKTGWLLLLMLLPQVVLYAIAFTAEAVMNAHGRFALAAAAPAVENSGSWQRLAAFAVLYGAAPSSRTSPCRSWCCSAWDDSGGRPACRPAVLGGAAGRRSAPPRMGGAAPRSRESSAAVPSLGYSGLNALRGFAPLWSPTGYPAAWSRSSWLVNSPSSGRPWRPPDRRPPCCHSSRRLFQQQRIRAFRDELVRGTPLMFFVASRRGPPTSPWPGHWPARSRSGRWRPARGWC